MFPRELPAFPAAMNAPAIGLLDDDPGILTSLGRLLTAHGYRVVAYATADDFLAGYRSERFDCAVVDLAMPGRDGFAVQEHLVRAGATLPLVFLTGTGDIPASVRAMKGGAQDFLTKPVDATCLLDAIRAGVIRSNRRKQADGECAALRAVFGKLSPREHEVLRHVMRGKLNKQVAADLGISEQTVKLHRMRIVEKTGMHSVAEWVRAAGRVGIEPAD
jgi:FixJ family two-component response regulator